VKARANETGNAPKSLTWCNATIDQITPFHFVTANGAAHPARLKGRAGIAADSGEVLHMETSLMEEKPAAKVRHWYLSIAYAPVQCQSQNVRMWLPLAVDTYYDFEDHRTIAYHTFTDFMLFSVQTDQAIQKPKNP
jgi:hypothetical protein